MNHANVDNGLDDWGSAVDTTPPPAPFPFIGCRLEIISTPDFTRYQGRLTSVDVENRCIKLVEVHHFGAEGRLPDTVGAKPAKGLLPPDEERTFFEQYIYSQRVLPVPPVVEVKMSPLTLQAEETASHPPPSATPTGPDKEGVGVAPAAQENPEQKKPTYPCYYIAQLQNAAGQEGQRRAVGVLINAEKFPSSPVYLAIPLAEFPSPPTLTQLWRVPSYDFRKVKTARRVLIAAQYQIGDHRKGLAAFEMEHGGTPWMVNQLINVEAVADSRGMQLVRDAIICTKWGRLSRLESKRKDSGEVDVPGCVKGIAVQMREASSTASSASTVDPAPNKRLAVGDRVQVEMVSLKAGCWVGPNFVLPPDIRYHSHRAPFRPSEERRHKTHQLTESKYYPVRIVPEHSANGAGNGVEKPVG